MEWLFIRCIYLPRWDLIVAGLFGPNDVRHDTNALTPEHIEAAVIFVQKLASTEKHARNTVFKVEEDTCTAHMLRDIVNYEWLDGAVTLSTNFVLNLFTILQNN